MWPVRPVFHFRPPVAFAPIARRNVEEGWKTTSLVGSDEVAVNWLTQFGESFAMEIVNFRSVQSAVFAILLAMIVIAKVDAEVLDQSHDFPPDQEGTIRSDIDRVQTFTVGVTGTLTRIELRARRFTDSTSAPLIIDIRNTSSGVPEEPNSPVLATTTASAGSIPLGSISNAPFTSFDLSTASLDVSSGDVLAIVLRSTDQYEWMKDNSAGYSGGSEFIRSTISPTWTVGELDDDFAFQTFVVPEPSAAYIFAAAFVSLGFRRKSMR